MLRAETVKFTELSGLISVELNEITSWRPVLGALVEVVGQRGIVPTWYVMVDVVD